MKVILTRDVKDLGKAGKLVNVAEGHARNFLIPRKLAIIADEGAMKTLEKKQQTIQKKNEKLLEEAKQIAEKLASVKVLIKAKAGSGAKLYGSVTTQEIADALSKQHKITVDKRKINLSEPIKSAGIFDVPIKLHHDINTNIKVEVVVSEEGK